MFDNDLLRRLRCPVTHLPLAPVDDRLLVRLNEEIAAGRAVDRLHRPIDEPLSRALVNQRGDLAYRVEDEVVDLLVDHAIAISPGDANRA